MTRESFNLSLPKQLSAGVGMVIRQHWPFLLLTLMITTFALWGVSEVPFHPDESTYLYMSGDLEILLSEPLSLAWTPEQAGDLRAHYRLIDAPLSRYLIGLGRWFARQAAPAADWDWTRTWQENQTAGALPNLELLTSVRFFLTLLIPLDLLLIYLIGIRMQDKTTGFLAAALLGANALALLHNRRAMAEASLTFGTLLALWCFLDGRRYPWLAGIGIAIAVNSKHTLVALIPIGFLAVIPDLKGAASRGGRLGARLFWSWAQYFLAFFMLTALLNPYLWKHPLAAAEETWKARQELMRLQVSDMNNMLPAASLDTPSKRAAALISNLFMAPPAFAETANYIDLTRHSEILYTSNPAHKLLRSFSTGGLMFGLTLAGMLLGILHLGRSSVDQKRAILIVLLATLFLSLGILWLVPLPWQRYVMPLVPFTCLWPAFVFGQLRLKTKTAALQSAVL